MRHLRFSLVSAFVVMTVAGLLLWANLQQRVVVSNSPSAFGLPGLVSIRFLSGWPVTHSWTSFLVMRDEAEPFISDYPESAGGMDPPSYLNDRLAMNAAVAVTLTAIAGMLSEWAVRRFGVRGIRPKPTILAQTSQSPRDSA